MAGSDSNVAVHLVVTDRKLDYHVEVAFERSMNHSFKLSRTALVAVRCKEGVPDGDVVTQAKSFAPVLESGVIEPSVGQPLLEALKKILG